MQRDIDLAIVLEDRENSFDIEVQLMLIREGEETLIEPHVFTKQEFDPHQPIVEQILSNGAKLTK